MSVSVVQKLSASVTYAVQVYGELIGKKVEPRAAYAAACELAGLRTAEDRRAMRNAVLRLQG